MFLIGLTGSIGMGKTTTSEFFRRRGVPVHDSDAAVHKLYKGEATPIIERAFPGTANNGSIDRALLANQVIGNPEALARLEAIIHPLVEHDRRTFCAQYAASGFPAVVLDIPLLFEVGYDKNVDIVTVVDADPMIQKSRVLARPGMTSDRLEALLAKQMPNSEKRRRAHFVIDTGRGLSFAARQVETLLSALSGALNG